MNEVQSVGGGSDLKKGWSVSQSSDESNCVSKGESELFVMTSSGNPESVGSESSSDSLFLLSKDFSDGVFQRADALEVHASVVSENSDSSVVEFSREDYSVMDSVKPSKVLAEISSVSSEDSGFSSDLSSDVSHEFSDGDNQLSFNTSSLEVSLDQ